MNRSVCLVSFSPIGRDARVLRQIECLAQHYRLIVIGFGAPAPVPAAREPVEWIRVPERETHAGRRLLSRLASTALLMANVFPWPSFLVRRMNEIWFWTGPYQMAARRAAMRRPCDVYCANDWTALPVAAEAARRHGGHLIFDAHEYAPLEFENRRLWRLRNRGAILHCLRKYAPQVDGFTTVCKPIGRRYEQEFGLEPTIVYNTPKRLRLPDRRIDPGAIRLVHHGAAFRDRCLEKMILALAACDRRFSLHFMLVPGHSGYIEELGDLARRLAHGRVTFHPPVQPERTAEAVAEYDMGFCLIEPSNYNYLMAAPNKFFDYIAAGMPVCIGPSPAMADIVHEFGLGCVAPSFAPEAVAATLNALDAAQLAAMQQGARRAGEVFHADAEMDKVIALYRRVLSVNPMAAPALPREGRAGNSEARSA